MKYPKHTYGSECEGCNERLKDAHPMIASFFYQMKDKYHDMHASCVFRNEADQNAALESGASKEKWPNSKHNKIPSLAIDLFQQNERGKAFFDPIFYARINAEAQKLGFDLRWGGDWNGNGKKDEKFHDSPHFELKNA